MSTSALSYAFNVDLSFGFFIFHPKTATLLVRRVLGALTKVLISVLIMRKSEFPMLQRFESDKKKIPSRPARRDPGNVWEGSHDPCATETDIYYCYRLLLGRQPSQTEWLAHLDQVGQNLTTIVASYLNSPERARGNSASQSLWKFWERANRRVADKSDIFYCFRLLLGRRPSQSEWLSHLDEVGGNLTAVVAAYLNSPEFASRSSAESLWKPWEREHRPVADENDIFYCFRLLLGRSPLKQEWPGHRLGAGQELTTVVKGYVSSLEFANRRILDNSTSEYETCQLDNFSMYLSRSDLAVGAAIASSRAYEPHVTRVLNERLGPGMTFLDVGANIGFFSLLAASLVGPSGKVFSIEPNPRNVKALQASKDLNDFEQIQVLQAAAGASWEILFLNTDHSNGVVSAAAGGIADLLSRETVLSCPIDAIVGTTKVDLIKIDVEGFEFKALTGASRCLELHKPDVISEFTPGALPGISNVTPVEYLNLFTTRKYDIYVLGPERPIPCGSDTDLVMKHFAATGLDHIDILCISR